MIEDDKIPWFTPNVYCGSVVRNFTELARIMDYIRNTERDWIEMRYPVKRNHNGHLGAQSDCPACIGKYCNC